MLKLKDLLSERMLHEAEFTEEELGKELAKAFASGPVATRTFLNSPMGQHAALNSLLKKPEPETDGEATDDKIEISGPSDISVDPGKMVPTQNFIDAMKSVSFPLGSAASLADAITRKYGHGTIVISDKLIIDGHHRWSGVVAISPDTGTINALDVTWPGDTTAQKLAAAQIAIASTLEPGTKQPSASGDAATDILGKKSAAIQKVIMDNVGKQPDPDAAGPLLNDKMMGVLTDPANTEHAVVFEWLGQEVFTEADPAAANNVRLAIAKKVGDNLESIKKNASAPARDDMPQFDPKVGGPDLDDTSTLAKDLKQGKINVAPPFVKDGVIKLKDLLGK